MKLASTLMAVIAICASIVNGATIDERNTTYNIICPPGCSGPLAKDCTAMANGLVAQGDTSLYMGPGANLAYKQGTCQMVFYITANTTITYSKFDIAQNIWAISSKCLGTVSPGPALGIADAKDGNWYQVLSLAVWP